MYLSFSLIFQIILLSCGYFLAIICFWYNIGSYIFLLGAIPLATNTILFTFPILNYFSLLAFSFLALKCIGVSWEYILYETLFWGVQGVWICVVIGITIITKRFFPLNPSRQQKKISKWIKHHDDIIVEFDYCFHTIIDISREALSFYGWNKKDLINKSLLLICSQDFIQNPPNGLVKALNSKQSWTGFVEVHSKNGNVYEERATYTPYFNSQGSLEKIQKRVIEAFYKEVNNSSQELYEEIFNTHPVPMLLINEKGLIEQSNKTFIRTIPHKAIQKKELFYNLFPSIMHKQINNSFKKALLGQENRLITSIDKSGDEVELIFIPYYDKRKEKIYKIFLILKPVSIFLPKNELIIQTKRKLALGTILKEVLTEFYYQYSTPPIKLMSGVLPTINIIEEQWKKLFYNILMFSLQEDIRNIKQVTVTCLSIENKHFFKISFDGISYFKFKKIASFDPLFLNQQKEFITIKKILYQLNSNPEIIEGNDNQAMINFLFQEN